MQETCSRDITELAKALCNVQRQLQPAMKERPMKTTALSGLAKTTTIRKYQEDSGKIPLILN